jgi:hypothetical protein
MTYSNKGICYCSHNLVGSLYVFDIFDYILKISSETCSISYTDILLEIVDHVQ